MLFAFSVEKGLVFVQVSQAALKLFTCSHYCIALRPLTVIDSWLTMSLISTRNRKGQSAVKHNLHNNQNKMLVNQVECTMECLH